MALVCVCGTSIASFCHVDLIVERNAFVENKTDKKQTNNEKQNARNLLNCHFLIVYSINYIIIHTIYLLNWTMTNNVNKNTHYNIAVFNEM